MAKSSAQIDKLERDVQRLARERDAAITALWRCRGLLNDINADSCWSARDIDRACDACDEVLDKLK
jgi:hypothetical protein